MKTLCTLLLVAVSFGAIAQRSSSKHVTTNGRQLRIRVDIEEPGRSVHYSRSFDVADMEADAVKTLENRIIDSLEQAPSYRSTAVVVDQKQEVCKQKKHSSESQGSTRNTAADSHERLEANASSSYSPTDTASFSPSDVAPSSVLVREDKENGRLWMQYTFQKDGEELIIERTANVVGKTEREKQAIIKETERSFGIKTGNQ